MPPNLQFAHRQRLAIERVDQQILIASQVSTFFSWPPLSVPSLTQSPQRRMPEELLPTARRGKQFPVELTMVPVKQNGEEFFCAFIRDISKRKKAEDELRKSELKYRSLIEQASDAIMITDFGSGNLTT